MKTVAQKMGIKDGMRAFFIHPDAKAISAIELPAVNISENAAGEFDYIHLFVKSQQEFEDNFPELKPHLKSDGMFWVSWPKGKQLGSDFSLPQVIKLGYNYGLVESTCLSINAIWSALKFTHPKKGKVYHNLYGKLKSRTTHR